MKSNSGKKRVIIENLSPQVNQGQFPAKRVLNERVEVEADIFSDGHDLVRAEFHYRSPGSTQWQNVEMSQKLNDRWNGSFSVDELGTWHFTVSGWIDHFSSWHRGMLAKISAGSVIEAELLVGAELIGEVLDSDFRIPDEEVKILSGIKDLISDSGKSKEERQAVISSGKLFNLMLKYPVKSNTYTYEKEFQISVERTKANFSSWYELFPRSLSQEPGKHGTFRDCIRHLDYVAEMGFDVLYLPPIHPIGEVNRKGKNNNTSSEPGEPGSPWAIGSKLGGHTSLHPELGSMDDFHELIRKAGEHGLEIAMDIAFQCAPDHPWIKEHPEWFKQRPDGSLQYAENPPKKYQDIYPLNFETDDWESLWKALRDVFLFWIKHEVKIFRVDNPHTKSLRFWGWVINSIREEHPDVIFLSEAFTRPKVMYQLAKQGFSQSYTYFTWRNTKYDLTTYLTELTRSEVREFFRPNFWPNTPDILPEFLQLTNRSGFIQRLFLAATLSSNYGIYGPAFELMENTPLAPGKEEYLNSEKYEIRQWDFNAPGNLRKIIARVNHIRKDNPALHNTHTLKFHDIDNEALLCYSKTSDNLDNIILVVVNLDPHHTHSGWIRLSLDELGLDNHTPFQVQELVDGSFYLWQGAHNYVEINPGIMPAHVFRIRRKVRTESDFDYFM